MLIWTQDSSRHASVFFLRAASQMFQRRRGDNDHLLPFLQWMWSLEADCFWTWTIYLHFTSQSEWPLSLTNLKKFKSNLHNYLLSKTLSHTDKILQASPAIFSSDCSCCWTLYKETSFIPFRLPP